MELTRRIGNVASRLYWALGERARGRPLIHVAGDSHTKAFAWTRGCVVHHLGPATAYRLRDPDNSTRSREKLFGVVDRLDPGRDVLLLVFGEIDCRIHIYAQHRKRNGAVSMEALMDEIITRYGSVMEEVRGRGIRFAVLGPPPATRQSNRYGIEFYATPDVHRFIYSEFNSRLRAYCRSHGYAYVDVYSSTVDENGFAQSRYAADDTHLNNDAARLVRRWVLAEYAVAMSGRAHDPRPPGTAERRRD